MKIKNIIIIILIVTSFLLVIGFVSADGCCLKDKSEQYCVNEKDGASAATCQSGSWYSTNCDQKTECTTKGCCYVDNKCMDNGLQLKCTADSGEYGDGLCKETLDNCKQVCCQVSSGGTSGYTYTSQSDCNSRQGTALDNILDGTTCNNLNNGLDAKRSCCFLGDGSCKRMLTTDCDSQGGQPYQGFYCRDVANCNPKCEPRKYTGPGKVGDEINKVYWYDSCGNQEELVNGNDPQQADAFKKVGLKPFNGDCLADPSSGVALAPNGQITCANLACNNVWDSPRTDENHDGNLTNDNTFTFDGKQRDFRYNDESWCEYVQAKIGVGLDLPGSKHFLHSCDRGNEVVDTSADGREKVCTEQVVDKTVKDQNGNDITVSMTKANWIPNMVSDCLACDVSSIYEANKTLDCCRQKQNCAFVYKKNLIPNKTIIYILSSNFKDMQYSIPQANKYLKLRYKKASVIIKEENFNTGIEGANENCDIDACPLTFVNPPDGTYEITVIGKGCNDFGCKTKEISLGEYSFNKGLSEGLCLPLIPPSNDQYCKRFNTGLGKVYDYVDAYGKYVGNIGTLDPMIDYNYYYDLPYIGFGNNDCQNTSQCRDVLLSRTNNLHNLNGRNITDILVSSQDALCSSFGDCGFKPNLLGTMGPSSDGTYLMEVCPFSGKYNPLCVGVYDSSYSKIYNAPLGKYSNLISGNPTRPEPLEIPSFIFFLMPSSFIAFFKKFKKKHFIIALILLHLLLYACAQAYFPPSVTNIVSFPCASWSPAPTLGDCGKCSLNWSQGGVLPDNNLSNLDGKPAYQCTENLCKSLGSCDFVSNKEVGGFCVPHKDYSIPSVNFIGADFTCSTTSPGGCAKNIISINNFIDNKEGEPSSITINGNLDENSDINISFKTIDIGSTPGQELPSICKYSTKPDTDSNTRMLKESFDDAHLDNQDYKKVHYFSLFGLVPGSYVRYIQCQDHSGAISTPAAIKFNVAKGPDIIVPKIYKIDLAKGNNFVKYGDTSKAITLYVNGKVNSCKWDNESVSFEDMGKTTKICKGCGSGGKDLVDVEYAPNDIFCKSDPSSSKSVCNGVVSNVKLGSNNYWFVCNGTNGKVSDIYPDDKKGIEIIGTSSLNITSISCKQSLGTDCEKIYDSSFGFSIRTVGGAQNGNAQCMWASEGYSYDFFSEPGGKIIAGKGSDTISVPNYASVHTQDNYGHSSGKLQINFLCNDIVGNIATNNVVINLERDIISPKLLKSYRYGNDLFILTSEESKCKYVMNIVGSFDNSTEFSSNDGLLHQTPIVSNFYRVKCEDRFNNTKETNIYISKLD